MLKRTCSIILLFGICIIVLSCNTSKSPVQIPNDPNTIWMRINDDATATNDTILWVKVTGQNVEMMKMSSEDSLIDLPWIPYDSLTIVKAPHIEGKFTLYAVFKFTNGVVSDQVSDDIILDFSVNINQVGVVTEFDTLRPGSWIEFSVITGESGRASVKFGSLFLELPLRPESKGVFRDILVIPPIVKHEDATVTAIFKDTAGNETTTTAPETYPVRGPELYPHVIGRIELPGAVCNDLWFHRGYCYVSTDNVVHIVNVMNEERPEYAGHIQTDVYNDGIAGNRFFLLVTDYIFGVSVYSLHNPDKPEKMGRSIVWGNAKDVGMNDEIAYVSSELNGLFVINMQSPANPERIVRLPLNCTGESLCYDDSLVYVAGSGGIAIVSVADPFHPYIVSQYSNVYQDIIEAVYHRGNLLLATSDAGLIHMNVEDPRNPFFVQEFEHLENCTDLFIDSSFLIVSKMDEISIVNLSNLDELPILAEVSDLDFPRALFARNGIVYVAEANSLTLIDLIRSE